MKNLTVLAAAAVVTIVCALSATSATAQSPGPYRNSQDAGRDAVYSQPGAGGRGGSGAGATEQRVSRRQSEATANNARTSAPPPLDPDRPIFVQDCTQPFDPAGKGNLRCL